MYECHGHVAMDGVDFGAAMARHRNGVDKEFVRRNLKSCAEAGISFFRDGGDRCMASAFAGEIAGEYGIDYRTPVFAIHKHGYYGSIVGRSFRSMKDFAALVAEARKLGADFIKIMASGILGFKTDGKIGGPSLTYEEMREAVRIASGEGFCVMAHVNGAENIKNALSAGVKSIEHGFWPDSGVIEYFLQSGAVWVPTVATVRNLLGREGFSCEVLGRILETQGAVLREAYAKGVLIACGSDSGAINVPHGKGTHDERSYLKELGIDTERGDRRISELFRAEGAY